MVQLLLQYHADATIKGNDLITALENGYEKSAKILIELGVDTDVINNKGFTAIMLAKSKGFTKIFNMLKEKNANSLEKIIHLSASISQKPNTAIFVYTSGEGYLVLDQIHKPSKHFTREGITEFTNSADYTNCWNYNIFSLERGIKILEKANDINSPVTNGSPITESGMGKTFCRRGLCYKIANDPEVSFYYNLIDNPENKLNKIVPKPISIDVLSSQIILEDISRDMLPSKKAIDIKVGIRTTSYTERSLHDKGEDFIWVRKNGDLLMDYITSQGSRGWRVIKGRDNIQRAKTGRNSEILLAQLIQYTGQKEQALRTIYNKVAEILKVVVENNEYAFLDSSILIAADDNGSVEVKLIDFARRMTRSESPSEEYFVKYKKYFQDGICHFLKYIENEYREIKNKSPEYNQQFEKFQQIDEYIREIVFYSTRRDGNINIGASGKVVNLVSPDSSVLSRSNAVLGSNTAFGNSAIVSTSRLNNTGSVNIKI